MSATMGRYPIIDFGEILATLANKILLRKIYHVNDRLRGNCRNGEEEMDDIDEKTQMYRNVQSLRQQIHTRTHT